MKTKILFVLAVLMSVLGVSEMKAQDTLWTKITGRTTWGQFTKDGTKVLFTTYNDSSRLVTKLLTADSGRVIWTDDTLQLGGGIISPDSITFLSAGGMDTSNFIVIRRLSDGTIIKRYDTLLYNNYPRPLPFHWIIWDYDISNDGRYLFAITLDDAYTLPNHTPINVIYKIDLITDRLIAVRKDSSLRFCSMKPNDSCLIFETKRGVSFYSSDSLKEFKAYNDWNTEISRSGRYITSLHDPGNIYTWDTQCDSIIKRNHLDSVSFLKTLRYTSNDSIIVLLYSTNKINHFLVYNIFTNTRINDFEFHPLRGENTFGFELAPDDSKLLVDGDGTGIYLYNLTLEPTAKKDDNNPQTIIQVNPNPTLGTVNIELNMNDSMEAKVSLYDSRGGFIMQIAGRYFDAGKNQLSFSTKNLSSGLYFIKVTGKGINQSTKLIINK